MRNSLIVGSVFLCLLFSAYSIVVAEEQVGAMPPDELGRATAESLMADFLTALDRLDLKAAERIASQAATEYPGRPETELMVRHARLLAAIKKKPTEENQSRQSDNADKDRIYTINYYVADLVLPPPTTHNSLKEVVGYQSPDYDSLIDLIEVTVKRFSWECVGGRGSIEPHKFSLVVKQTKEAHEEIADLLQQLRRLQDINVLLEVRFFSTSKEEASEIFSSGENKKIKLIMSPSEASNFLDAAKRRGIVQTCCGTSMRNGQLVAVPYLSTDGKSNYLGVQAVISNDRRYLRTIVTSGDKEIFPRVILADSTIMDGGALLIHLPPESEKKHPDECKNDAASGHRFLMITPRMCFQEEEEERLDDHLGGRLKQQSAKRPAVKYDLQPAVPAY